MSIYILHRPWIQSGNSRTGLLIGLVISRNQQALMTISNYPCIHTKNILFFNSL